MMIFKCIFLIALLQYSCGETLENRIRRSPRKTKAPVTPGLTSISKRIVSCGENKECTSFQHCDNGKLVTDGDNLIDLRDDINNVCSHYLDVCCDAPNITVDGIDISKNNKIATKCGVLNPTGVGMKIKEAIDREAQFGEFPWMIVVLKKVDMYDQVSNVYHCGGSLIHPSVVLTVGHKVDGEDPLDLTVRAGEWDTQTTSEHLAHVESNVASMVVHKDLNKGNGINNIALLFLASPIANNKHINTICLPPPHMNFDGARCFVTGWGKHKFGQEGKYQEILKKIELPVIDRQKCTEMFRKTRLGKYYILNESFICAGGETGVDSCTGDGGSPLVCPDNSGNYYQAGIVAFGIGCGENNVPGGYTNVAFFADWIEEEIQYQEYNSSSYTL